MVHYNLVNEVVSEVIAFAHFEYIYSTKNDREEVMRFYFILFYFIFFCFGLSGDPLPSFTVCVVVLTPADGENHIDKTNFTIPFVCGARDLGEALRRIAEGASMIRTKGEAGTG